MAHCHPPSPHSLEGVVSFIGAGPVPNVLQPGQRVKHRGTGEVGVVVCAWEDASGDVDAYVAFFGESFPEGEPSAKPYVLRYYSSSLEVLT